MAEKKYCQLCARWNFELHTGPDDLCPIHGRISMGRMTTLADLEREFRRKIRDAKMQKVKVNESLQRFKDFIKVIKEQ